MRFANQLRGFLALSLLTRVASAAFVDLGNSTASLSHGYSDHAAKRPQDLPTAGVAAADYDRDGWIDLYLTRGTIAPNALLRNNGDGTFSDVAATAGVAVHDHGAGPLWADLDGDGWVDLIVLGLSGAGVHLFRNLHDGTFADATANSGLAAITRDSFSASAADYDRDGDLDLFLTHWGTFGNGGSTQQLWRNDGNLRFTDVSRESGVMLAYVDVGGATYGDLSFTANFVDYDDDGWPDLLVAGDFGTTKLLHNEADGRFRNATTAVISDENGMGAAIGDYDNDGYVDWFVSSIWDPDGVPPRLGNWGISGNRMYRNVGGTFVDATDVAGVRHGHWGWGSTFTDINNDGWLDLIHVNGWTTREAGNFHNDPTVCFLNQGDGTFRDATSEMGLVDSRQGRGIVAFDYDRDGDVDILIANHEDRAHLFRNDAPAGQFLGIALRGSALNSQAIGAKIMVSDGRTEQRRDVRAGNNFVSQDPAEVHVGLGQATRVDVRVYWPEAGKAPTVWTNVPAQQRIEIAHPDWLARRCAGDCDGDGATRVDDLLKLVSIALEQQLPARCAALDAHPVEVDQIVRALNATLSICEHAPA